MNKSVLHQGAQTCRLAVIYSSNEPTSNTGETGDHHAQDREVVQVQNAADTEQFYGYQN